MRSCRQQCNKNVASRISDCVIRAVRSYQVASSTRDLGGAVEDMHRIGDEQ